MSTSATDSPRFVLRDQFVDIPALADSVSASHARLSRFKAEGRPIGPDAQRLIQATDGFVSRVQRAVSDAVAPVAPVAPSPVERPRRQPAARRNEAALAVSYIKGMLATRAASAERAPSPRQRPIGAVVRDVLPGMVAQAARNDIARLRVVAGPAIEEAGRRANGLVHVALSQATREMTRVSERLASFSKFGEGAHVRPVGKPDGALLAAGLRPLALVVSAGILTFTLGGTAQPQAQGLDFLRGGPAVSVQQTPSGMDRLRSAAPNMVEPPSIPMPGFVSSGPIRVDAGPARASGLSTPEASSDPLAGLRGGPAPSAAVESQPRRSAPLPATPGPASSVVQAQDGGPAYSVTDAMAQRGTKGGPSKAFIDLAVATIGVNTEDYADAPSKLGNLIWTASDCIQSFGPVAKCKVEAHGVALDFASGTHTATLLPMANVSSLSRQVANETKAGGLRIPDRDAMAIVLAESTNHTARMMSETVATESENDADPVAPRP